MINKYIKILYSHVFDPSNIISEKTLIGFCDSPAKVSCMAPYCFLFPYGDISKKPLMYFHNDNLNRIRHNGITFLGDGYLEHQSLGIHHKEMAQEGKAKYIKTYEKTQENPLTYTLLLENPYCRFDISENYISVKEADVLDLKLKPFNFEYFDHHCLSDFGYQILCPCFVSGYYKNIPVVGLGNFDRFYLPETIKNDVLGESCYLMIMGHGIRQNGKFESYYISINFTGCENNSYKTCGYYYLEGEEPIYSENCKIITKWEHLPYVDDDTCIFGDAKILIEDKTINFKAKWGCKGFTEKPRIERHGQAQVFGTWYEGNVPYEHKLYFTFNETLNCFGNNLKKYGFEVI